MDRERRLAALFDMDGVVLDTEGQYDNFWREQGRRYHPDKPEFQKMIKGQTTGGSKLFEGKCASAAFTGTWPGRFEAGWISPTSPVWNFLSGRYRNMG